MLVKVPLSWLRVYCEIPWPTEELADRLTMAGLEVDGIDTIGPQFDDVVIGAVTAVEKHPNADRLSVCQVNTGTETLEIVCGAPNVAAGQRVPVAIVGAKLPGGFKIKKSKIRGVVSQGMICSEAELHLSEEADGIMVLDSEAPLGEPFADLLGKAETVLSVDVGTNRPDCLSLIGIAREVAAMTRESCKWPSTDVEETGAPVNELASVTIEDHADCPRFVGRVITAVAIGPSPDWMVHHLEAAGIRSINNVVDITNFVMLEMGQPLHAYDLDTLAGHEIIVKRAQEGASFTTLDETERKLTQEVLMISDRDRNIGAAGIMGGLNTEITEETTNVFLEGACFDAMRVRRGAKLLGLSTDASRRFERGMNPELQGSAVDRAAQLIAQLGEGVMAAGRIDVREPATPSSAIRLRTEQVNALLGTSISQADMVDYLEALEFTVTQAADLLVEVPSFRRDISREADLIEEIARIYGYDRIEPVMSSPTKPQIEVIYEADRHLRETQQRWKHEIQNRLRETMVSNGFTEVITHSFVNPDDLKLLDPDKEPLELDNPISGEYSVMRTTITVPILGIVRWNSNRKIKNIRIFEIGRVFNAVPGEPLPAESLQLCVAMTGQRLLPHWSQNTDPIDFFDIKGVVENTLGRFALDNVQSVSYDGSYHGLDMEQSANLAINDNIIGAYGIVSQNVLDFFDIQEPVWLYILDCEQLMHLEQTSRTYHALPKYPAVERDLAIVVSEDVDFKSVTEVIRESCSALLEDIQLFDVYRGQQVPAGKKSLAYALRYRSSERTLTDEEVTTMQMDTVKRLGAMFGAELR